MSKSIFPAFTGVDKRVLSDHIDLINICAELYNVDVELGVLLSLTRQGNKGQILYPKKSDREKLFHRCSGKSNIKTAIHLCDAVTIGALAEGDSELIKEVLKYERIQINMAYNRNSYKKYFPELMDILIELNKKSQIIIQYNTANKEMFDLEMIPEDFAVVVDFSGGTGSELSEEHLQSLDVLQKFHSVGIAGGLSPENIKEKMQLIRKYQEQFGNIQWTDCESKIRNNGRFVPSKVTDFLYHQF